MSIHNKSTMIDPMLRVRIESMKTKRGLWEDTLEEAYRLALPQRENFNQQTKGSEKNTEYNYDSTAQNAVQDFAANIQGSIVPAKRKWAILEPAEDVKQEQKIDAAKFLQKITDKVFKYIHNSNLDNVIGESFQDLAIGTGAVVIEETGELTDPVRCTAIPADELLIEPGPEGKVETVFREYKMSVRNLILNYPGASPDRKSQLNTKHAEDEVTIMEGVIRNPKTKQFELYSIDWEKGYVMQYAEMRTSPYVVFRWGKNPGEVWGRGPVIQSLPDIRALNQLAKLELQAAAFAVNGVYTLNTDQGTLGRNNKIEPGSIIALRSNQKLENLNVNTELKVSQITGDKLRESIKMALFSDRLPPLGSTPHTATEISIRQQEFHRVIGPAFGRLTFELVEPIINRFIDILQNQGILEEFKLDNQIINIKVQSPITRHTEELDKIQQFITGMTGLVAPFGEAGLKTIVDNINLDKLPRVLAGYLGVDMNIFFNEDEKKERVAAENEQQQETNMLQDATAGAEIANKLGVQAGDLVGGNAPAQ